MSTATTTIVFIGMIALAMAVTFLVIWWRDSKNSDEIAADTERLDTDSDIDESASSTAPRQRRRRIRAR